MRTGKVTQCCLFVRSCKRSLHWSQVDTFTPNLLLAGTSLDPTVRPRHSPPARPSQSPKAGWSAQNRCPPQLFLRYSLLELGQTNKPPEPGSLQFLRIQGQGASRFPLQQIGHEINRAACRARARPPVVQAPRWAGCSRLASSAGPLLTAQLWGWLSSSPS